MMTVCERIVTAVLADLCDRRDVGVELAQVRYGDPDTWDDITSELHDVVVAHVRPLVNALGTIAENTGPDKRPFTTAIHAIAADAVRNAIIDD